MSAKPNPGAIARVLAGALTTIAACGEPERNGPVPIGVSAGSVTVGGVTASGSATATAGSDSSSGDGTAGTAGTVGGATMPDPSGSTSLTDPTLTTDLTGSDSTGNGGCQVGESCESDGVCLQQLGPDGPIAVCSHGFSGEACELDIHCQSMECVTRVGEGGAVSYCA